MDILKKNLSIKKILHRAGLWYLLRDYSNQGGWGMSVFLKRCKFEHIELSIHF